MDTFETQDREYQTAAMEAMGRGIAEMFKGLVAGGMSRDEALEVITAYVVALARPKDSYE